MRLAAILFMMAAPVLAGIAVIVITSIPSLYDQGMRLIPWAVVAAVLLAIPVSRLGARQIRKLTGE